MAWLLLVSTSESILPQIGQVALNIGDCVMRVLRVKGELTETLTGASPPEEQLAHFRNVTHSVALDAMNVWADIWAELEDAVACGVAVTVDSEKGFEPSCGWPEFLEKMWVLRHHLDFIARYSRQEKNVSLEGPASS
jgi:hypothetical protein